MLDFLSNRHKLIVSYLYNNNIGTAREIADFLSVSQKTIKDDIKFINEQNIDGIKIVSKRGYGYSLNSGSEKLKKELESFFKEKDLILQNYERIAAILIILLQNGDYIRYEDIADRLFVSRSTLQKHMKKVRELLETFTLKIEHRPGYGVMIRGDEYDFRRAISFYFYSSIWGMLARKYILDDYQFDEMTKIKIMQEIKYNLNTCISIDDNQLENLAKKVFLAFRRDKIDINIDCLKKDEQNTIISSQILHSVKQISGMETAQLSKQSVDYTAHYLTGFNRKDVPYDKILIEKILQAIIQEIGLNFNIDFTHDKLIKSYLKSQLIKVLHRLKYKTILEKSSLLRYFKEYLFAAKITITAINVVEKIIGQNIPFSEYSDFILIFASALERNKKRLVLGVHTGNNQNEELLISLNLEKYLDKNSYDIRYINSLSENQDFDLVLTNSNVSRYLASYSANQIQFTNKELSSINQKIKQHFTNENKSILQKYINEDSILIMKVNEASLLKEKLIAYLEDKAYFKPACTRELMYHEVGNRVLHIQDINKILARRICLLVVLEQPIIWKNTLIEYVVLIKTKKDGDKDLNFLCHVFSNLISNTGHLHDVKKNKDHRYLIDKLSDI